MSLCDTCRNPGRCCSGFWITNGALDSIETPLEVLVWMATVTHADPWMGNIGLPFLPLYRLPQGMWRLWCPRLGRDGRCNDYENRPSLCRKFEAGRDQLCAEWDGAVLPTEVDHPEAELRDIAKGAAGE